MQFSMQFGKMARASALAGIAVAAVVSSGCAGGANRIDPKVPAARVRDISGTWGVTSLANNEKFVTCQDPNNILGSAVSELVDRGVVVSSCGPSDTFTFGPSDNSGNGTYTVEALGNVSEGTYTVEKERVTLVRTRSNGAALAAPLQKIVYAIVDTADGIDLVPVAQPVAYKLRSNELPATDEDGRVIVENLTPVLNADNTVNTIVLPNTDSVAVVQTDLTVKVGNFVTTNDVTDTPGFVRSYFVKRSLRKR